MKLILIGSNGTIGTLPQTTMVGASRRLLSAL
jgi:hypothetical protein